MIVIKLWCSQQGRDDKTLNELRKLIIDTVLATPELKLGEQNHVIVIFPKPELNEDPQSDVVFEIFGEFKNNPNDEIVLRQLTESVTSVFQKFHSHGEEVICTANTFDPQKKSRRNLNGIFLN